MRAAKKSTALVIRPRSAWKQCLMLSLAAFGLTIAAVYLVSMVFMHKVFPEKGSQAIAIVQQKPPVSQNNIPQISLLREFSNLKQIKTRILSPEFIRLALLQCDIDILQTVENGKITAQSLSPMQIQQGLTIHVKQGAFAGADQIILDLRLRQSPHAAKIARALADRFVQEYRAYSAAFLRQANLDALTRTDRAYLAHCDALEKLQAFKDYILKQEQATLEQQTLKPDAAEKETQQMAEQESQQTVENPAWIELRDKLASLQRRKRTCSPRKRLCIRISNIYAAESPNLNNNCRPRRASALNFPQKITCSRRLRHLMIKNCRPIIKMRVEK